MPAYNLTNQPGALFRAALNTVLGKLQRNYAGTVDPVSVGEAVPGMFWIDTTAGNPVLKVRNGADTAWITVGTFTGSEFQLVGTTSFTRSLLNDVDAATARETIGAGSLGLEFIAKRTAINSSSLNFTEFDPAKYDSYVYVLQNLRPATDGVRLLFRTSTNGGSSYSNGPSDYSYSFMFANHTPTASPNVEGDDESTAIVLAAPSVGNAAAEFISGRVELHAPALVAPTAVTFQTHAVSLTGISTASAGSGLRVAAADVDAVRFQFSSGDIASGSILMFGYRVA